MVILGAISGIQNFIFAVPEDEGGQARMLRARSFYVQGLVEVLAFHVQNALGLSRDTLLFAAAGRFALDVPDDAPDLTSLLRQVREFVEEALLKDTAGALNFSLAAESFSGAKHPSIADRYQTALAALAVEKQRPWRAYGAPGGRWDPQRLVLRNAGDAQRPDKFREIGKVLPRSRYLLIAAGDDAPFGSSVLASFGLLGYRALLVEDVPNNVLKRAALVADLSGGTLDRHPAIANRIGRPLARHVPLDSSGAPSLFEDLAWQARGAPFMGVLKMDIDSLGPAFQRQLQSASSSQQLADMSRSVDEFFAIELDQMLRSQQWQSIYTIFSGGDDLLLVGPWNIMLDFAGVVRAAFAKRFGHQKLTLSGGLALVKYRHPIRRSAGQADELLESAKTRNGPGETSPKDQMAALGQIWKWERHDTILAEARRLADWVENGLFQRGWLHTMLQHTLLRRGEARADGSARITSRLAYHIARNYPRAVDRDPDRRAVREWADGVAGAFDCFDGEDATVRYLPVILRYALLATRRPV